MLGLVEKSGSQAVTSISQFKRCDRVRSPTGRVLTSLNTAISVNQLSTPLKDAKKVEKREKATDRTQNLSNGIGYARQTRASDHDYIVVL